MRTLLAILLSLPCAVAHAQFAGTVTGTVSAIDTRTDPYAATGYSTPVSGARQGGFGGAAAGAVPLEEILVHLEATLPFPQAAADFWVRTNATGIYSIPWTTASRPTALRVEVLATRPDIGENTIRTGASQPPFEFRVTTLGVSDIMLGARTLVPGATTGLVQAANFTVGTNLEIVNAYRTARETYEMLGVQTQPAGGTLRNDMEGVNIFTNASIPGVSISGGVAPLDTEILLLPGTATANPFSVAHELGHIVEYRALDVSLPPAGPAQYEKDAPFLTGAWHDFSNEFEKAAFQEGFAHLVGAMWMWVRSADPVDMRAAFPGDFGPTSLESPTQHPTGARACDAEAEINGLTIVFSMGHRRATCVARGLWDIVDRPASDGDAIQNRDLGDVVRVLRAYPRFCAFWADNGCVNEGGDDDGMNWSDFRRNFQGIFAQSLGGIESSNKLERSRTD